MTGLGETIEKFWSNGRRLRKKSVQILAYVAETERTFIKQRQAEGIAAAKQKGVKFGCKKQELPKDFEIYYHMWNEGKISLRKAAKALQMNHSTFYRRCKEQKEIKESCFKKSTL